MRSSLRIVGLCLLVISVCLCSGCGRIKAPSKGKVYLPYVYRNQGNKEKSFRFNPKNQTLVEVPSAPGTNPRIRTFKITDKATGESETFKIKFDERGFPDVNTPIDLRQVWEKSPMGEKFFKERYQSLKGKGSNKEQVDGEVSPASKTVGSRTPTLESSSPVLERKAAN